MSSPGAAADVPDAVSEEAAKGRIAEVYAEYRSVTGLAHTSLMLRELAGNGPAVLDAAWSVVRPHYAGETLSAARDALLAAAVLPPFQFAPDDLSGLVASGERGAARLRATLRMFATANATNLILVHLLARPAAPEVAAPDARDFPIAEGSTTLSRGAGARETNAEPLPLPAPDSLPRHLQEQVMAVARAVVDEPPPGWWPTLLLCVAPFPPLLDAFAREVGSHVHELRGLAGALDEHAGALASALSGTGDRAGSSGLGSDAAAAVGRLVTRYLRILPAFTALAQTSLKGAELLDEYR